jgi:hypothetical protein
MDQSMIPIDSGGATAVSATDEKLGDWARPNISKHWKRMNRESKPPLYHGGRDDMR